MTEHERRGVSFGTVLMLMITAAVLGGMIFVLPQLMGPMDMLLTEHAMRATANLNDSLPELRIAEIPVTSTTHIPEPTEEPQPTATQILAAVPTIAPTKLPVQGGSLTMTFGGSICMDKYARQSGYYPDTEKYDFTDNLSLIASEMNSDLTMVTLESITDPSGNVRQQPNTPHEVMDMLASAGVDVVALGYNRAFERGLTGVQATVEQARKRGLETLGLYTSPEDAERIRIIPVGGVDVGFLHYSNVLTNTAKRKLNAANAAYAQPVAKDSTGAELIAADIRKARECGADIVVVSINWSGNESIDTTKTKMKSFMQTLADAGADLIVGAGTKAVKPVSWIMGKRSDGSNRQTLCAWSLGSLFTGDRSNDSVTGMLLHLQLSWDGNAVSFERVTYTPTYIWRFKPDSYYRYRVVASDVPAPDGMDESQASNAERAFERLKKTLGDSPVNLRTK